jgi:quercetin dioxygenase-like cupin family protein
MDAPPALPSGAQMAVVSGDPGKKGMFTIRLKMPADYAVPAHHHPTDEHVSVVSGKIGYGMSDHLDREKAKSLAPGNRLTMKAGMNHWVFANAPAVVQVSGMGPFQITYVDPKDDPRSK